MAILHSKNYAHSRSQPFADICKKHSLIISQSGVKTIFKLKLSEKDLDEVDIPSFQEWMRAEMAWDIRLENAWFSDDSSERFFMFDCKAWDK